MAWQISLRELDLNGVIILNKSELPDFSDSSLELCVGSIADSNWLSAAYYIWSNSERRSVGTIKPFENRFLRITFPKDNYPGHIYHPRNKEFHS